MLSDQVQIMYPKFIFDAQHIKSELYGPDTGYEIPYNTESVYKTQRIKAVIKAQETIKQNVTTDAIYLLLHECTVL